MDKAKQKRSTLRSLTTKLITKTEASISDEDINVEHLEDLFDGLTLKQEELTLLDNEIQNVMSNLEEINDEVLKCDEYNTNILKSKRKIKRTIDKCKSPISIPTANDVVEGTKFIQKRAVESPFIKLPLLTIEKFSGEFCDWQRFWDQFESAIHKNQDLSNVERLSYLKSYLTGDAARSIEGFAITNNNYESVVDTLTERFGKKQLVFNSHLNKLLTLHPVKRSSDIQALRKLLDSCETQIRSLNSLGVNAENYGSLLAPILIKLLPADIILEITKTCGSDEWKVDEILQILKTEVISRERMLSLSTFVPSETIVYTHSDKQLRANRSATFSGGKQTAALLFNETAINKDRCLFCENEHPLSDCKIFSNKNMKEKKEFLFKRGICFSCLKIGHRVKSCKSYVKCKKCFKRHFSVMCPEIKESQTNKGDVTSKDISTSSDHALSNKTRRQNVMMQTLLVCVLNKNNNKQILIRALYDSGSQYSYLSMKIIKKIGYVATGHEKMHHSLFGGREEVRNHCKYKIHLSNLSGNYCCNFDVYDQDKICTEVPKIRNGPWIREAENMGISFSDFNCSDKLENEEIDLLIGADVCGKLLTGNIIELKCGVIAIETRLGWSLIGKTQVESEPTRNESISALSLLSTERKLSDLWELDVIGIKDPSEKQTKAELEEETKTHFSNTVERESDGRYTISLPWVRERSFILNNKSAAEVRLKTTVKKLKETGHLEAYENVFREWLNENIIEEVKDAETECSQCYYLPHRAVVKESSTTKIRPVFDASAKGKNSLSLNDCLETGPNLIELIPSTLNRFRLGKYGLTADIRRAFLQINVNPQDRDYLRFLWWEEGNPERLKVLRHRRLVFGVSSSPFILAATLEHLITNTPKHLEAVAKKLKKSMYVDNCLTSVDTLDELNDFVHKSRELMFLGKFDLRGWVHNKLRSEDCEGDILETSFSLMPETQNNGLHKEEVVSLLGLKWNVKNDTLSCDMKNINHTFDGLINKRLILSTANQIYDPQGFLTPVTLMPKILLQECWKLKIGWDAELPKTISKKFVDWAYRLQLLEVIEIPRKFPEINESTSLHVFCDASCSAYATCIFLRSETEQSVKCQLIQARSKVAPIKTTSISRLELLACMIGARLAHSVKKDLSLEDIQTFYWSDSGNALYWIKRNENWATFVYNRAKEIRSLSDPKMWNHIAGPLNPADLPSRGCSAETLSKSKWWEGPDWLTKTPDEWPKSEAFPDFNVTNSEKKKTVLGATNLESPVKQIYDQISCYNKLVRVTAWILRFLHNCKPNNTNKNLGNLSLEEINKAEIILFKTVQEESFEGTEDKKLNTLKIVVDSSEILRIESRISRREDLPEFRYPILLPSDHSLVIKLRTRKIKPCWGTDFNVNLARKILDFKVQKDGS